MKSKSFLIQLAINIALCIVILVSVVYKSTHLLELDKLVSISLIFVSITNILFSEKDNWANKCKEQLERIMQELEKNIAIRKEALGYMENHPQNEKIRDSGFRLSKMLDERDTDIKLDYKSYENLQNTLNNKCCI